MTGNQQSPNAMSKQYTPLTLSFYDLFVIGFSVPFVWRCSAQKELRPLFSNNFSNRHVDIGVGTGYFPTKAIGDVGRNPKDQHLTLVDLSEHSLSAARRRVLSKYPDVYVESILADAVKPMSDSLRDKRFDSASLFLVIHHLSQPSAAKANAIINAKSLLTKDGVLVGCTILGKQWEKNDQGYTVKNEKPVGRVASFLLGIYNKRGIFDNWEEDPNVLTKTLMDEFEEVETKVVAMMFLFKASKPRG